MWNTYGPTEATVVACAARLDGAAPVRIGLPLDGWDLAVVGPDRQPVADGDVGELIIGGVGLARYLDPVKDAEKYAPMPTLGWDRAYRSGDLVRNETAGLLFVGRADDQVKLGGRRIELGEVDSALLAVPGVTGAAAAVRRTGSGGTVLVGYVAVREGFAHEAALAHLRSTLPAPLVPRLAVVEDLPTRTSGKIDRDALPWPVATGATMALPPSAPLDGTAGWLQSVWEQLLGVVPGPSDDFFDSGGGSLSAAQLVSALRERFPDVTVAHVYATPTLQGLAGFLDEMDGPVTANNPAVDPVHRGMQAVQVLASILLRTVSGLRWLTWVAAAAALANIWSTADWLPAVSWWWVLAGWLLLVSPAGRILLAAGGARLVLRNVQPGDHPRGGRVHARVWLAELWVGELGAVNLSTAPWMRQYARLLGAQVGRNVDLHAIPPVTGMLRLEDGCSIEAEVDLAGYWIDGDVLHLGGIRVRADARVGARSTLLPGADIGTESEIAPGSAVFGEVPAGEWWSGSPARRNGKARGPVQQSGPDDRPSWLVGYAATSLAVAALPGIATIAAVLVFARPLLSAGTLGEAVVVAVSWTAVAATGVMVVLALLVWAAVRAWSAGLAAGAYPVYSRRAWQAWSVLRVLDEARTWLFPLYSSGLTPSWLRALGAQVGRDVEASTVLLIPKLTTVGEGAFLADDTLLGGYELGGGWMRIGEVKVGKHAFVGNSGMTAPGRKVPRQGLVAVLSAAPARAHAKRGTSWLGSPPEPLRRTGADVDQSRTFHPPRRLRWARGAHRAVPAGPGVAPRRARHPGLRRPSLAARPQCRAGHRALGGRPPGGRRRRRRAVLAGQVGAGRTAASVGASTVELVCLAQRAGRHLRRGPGRSVVRPGGGGYSCPQRLAAKHGSEGGPWGVVRHLLASRDGPDPAGGRCDGQPGMCRADPPLPRPDAQHGYGDASGGGHLGAQQHRSAGGHPRAAQHRRSGFVGDERRVGARPHSVDR